MSAVSRRALACDLWICDSLGGATPNDGIWLARLRGLALGGGALTLAMSGWKAIGSLTISDLLLTASVLLLLPRFKIANARRMWVPALAVALIAVGGVIGTAATSGADVTGSAEELARFVLASAGAIVIVVCWRPGLEQITSFSWLWVAGGVISALVAVLVSDLARPPGLTPHPTHLAIISLVLLGVTLGLIDSDRRRAQVVVGLAASGALLAAIVASGSRAGLAAAILVVLLALLATRNRIAIAVAVGVVCVGLALAGLAISGDTEYVPNSSQDNALERLFQEGADPGRKRKALNTAAWDRFKSQPVAGVGFADARKVHNLFLQVGSSAGVLGILGAVMLVVLTLRTYMIAVWKRMAENPQYWAVVAGFAGAMTGYLAQSVFENVLWDRSVWIALALMAWGVSGEIRRDQGPAHDPPSP